MWEATGLSFLYTILGVEKASAVLLLGGRASRYQKEKAFEEVEGEAMFVRASRPFVESGVVSRLVFVARKDLIDEVEAILSKANLGLPYDIVQGGDSREESAKQGLSLVWHDIPALVHDACRPYLSKELVRRIYENMTPGTIVVPAIHPREAVYSSAEGDYLEKNDLYLIETPEGLFPSDFFKAKEKLGDAYLSFPDEGSMFVRAGLALKIVEGEPHNEKVTFPGDLR